MQSTSALSRMSPAENLFRRLQSRGVTLREGQKAFVEYVSAHPEQSVYNAVMPTGYGKSKAAECVCDVLKQQKRVDRCLFVVPTDAQREQYASNVAKDVEKMGLDLRLMPRETDEGVRYGAPVVLSGTVADLRADREDLCEVYITTIQSVHANRGWYLDLMTGSHRWCVFADEYQKLNREEGAQWGKALEALPYEVLFGLTATPVRTDRKDTVFAGKSPDVEVTFQEAYEQRTIRRVAAHIEHYFVDVIVDDAGTVERVTTENIEEYDISRDLRLTSKYYASLLNSAYACLEAKNARHPDQHQMLVFAMGVTHARSVSDTLNALFGKGVSEWVGVGPAGRPAKENRDILRRYKSGEILCLVQVDIAGEGFDNPRSSVLVFLTLLRKASVRAVQYAGRGLRRNHSIGIFEEDVCDMFASPDTEMAELIGDLASQTMDPNEMGGEGGAGGPGTDRLTPVYEIGPFDSRVKDAEFDRSEVIETIPQADVDMFRGAVTRATGAVVSDERLLGILADERMEQMKKARAMEERPEAQREKVKQAQSILVSNVLRMRFGVSVPKTAAGDLHKTVNREWIRRHGRGHAGMLEEDFRKKYEWLKRINEELDLIREVPLWLQL